MEKNFDFKKFAKELSKELAVGYKTQYPQTTWTEEELREEFFRRLIKPLKHLNKK
ncbi:MAG: hypothetical protein J6M60_04325 [Clostridia bacterium]|nr:hypothetical protein [Clostridia bacterium]